MMGKLPQHIASFAEPAGSGEPRNFAAIMRWPDGCQAAFLSENSAGSRREEYVFHGIERTLTATAERLRIETPAGISDTTFVDDAQGFAAEHRAFLDGVRGGPEPLHSIAALAPSLLVAELIERGFSGPVPTLDEQTAERRQEPVNRAMRKVGADKAVLVINPRALHNALPALASRHPVVSIEDIRAAGAPRHDVVAAIIGRDGGPLPEDVLEMLPGLAIVAVAGLSLGRYGVDALFARGVCIANAGEAYARTVAEFTLGLALLGRRRAFLSHHVMRAGGWGSGPVPGMKNALLRAARASRPMIRATLFEPMLTRAWTTAKGKLRLPDMGDEGPYGLRDFHGVSVGLVGWSQNARAFAELLRPFEARVKVYSEHASDDDIGSSGAQRASLDEVLKSEIVSLHRGLTAETRHFLGAAELALLRPGAVFVNTARGGLVDPNALIARLRRGDVFACLDTYDEEPLPRSHPLRRLSNVFLTAHIAGGTQDMHEAAAREVVDKVVRYLRGEPVKTVSIEQWRRMS
jgi:phosphoglycerate dehydrogenase-like enzyme